MYIDYSIIIFIIFIDITIIVIYSKMYILSEDAESPELFWPRQDKDVERMARKFKLDDPVTSRLTELKAGREITMANHHGKSVGNPWEIHGGLL